MSKITQIPVKTSQILFRAFPIDKKYMRVKCTGLAVEDLQNIVVQEWNDLEDYVIIRLAESMPERVNQLRLAKREYINY